MKKLFGILPFIIIAISVYITLSNRWIAPGINQWQAGMMNDQKYFPVLTAFIIALPALILLLLIKYLLDRRSKN
jgi:hypothetical protein